MTATPIPYTKSQTRAFVNGNANIVYVDELGNIGSAPEINGDGAIEAIVSHRIGTQAQLITIGILPVGEVVIEVDGSGVPVGLRAGDVGETLGGYPVGAAVNRVSVTSLTLSSESFVAIPGLEITVPANSLVELAITLRTSITGDLGYSFFVFTPQQAPMILQDGASSSIVLSGDFLVTTGPGRTLTLPTTLMRTTTSYNVYVGYQKTSGVTDLVLTEADIIYRVVG